MFAQGVPWIWVAVAVQVVIIVVSIVRIAVVRRRIAPRFVVPQYEPMREVDAAMAAILLRKRKRAGTAAILEQAVDGAIRIHRTAHGTFRAEFVRSFAGLRGQALEGAIFGHAPKHGETASVGPRAVRNNQRRQSLATWVALTMSQPVLKRRPGAGILLPLIGLVLGPAFFVMTIMDLVSQDSTFPASSPSPGEGGVAYLIFFVISIFVCVTLFIISVALPTRLAAEARNYLEGMRMFMLWAEADRLKMLQSPSGAEVKDGVVRIYERLLPYAIAMGIEREWARVVALRMESAPYWYVDAGGAGSAAFVVGIAGAEAGFSADGFAASVGDMCDGGVGSSDGGGSGSSDGGGGMGFGSGAAFGGDGGFGGGGDGGGGGGGGDGGGGGGGGDGGGGGGG